VGLASFGRLIAEREEVDMTVSGRNRPPSSYATTAQLVEAFDANVAASRQAMATIESVALATPWTLRAGDHVIFTMPRAMTFRVFMMNHLIHHRGQLSVYLRELEVPLPSIYGPTADT
jgi:uncharacterized damage-inducible protein DinB